MPTHVARLIRSRVVWPVAIAFSVLSVLTSEIAYRVARGSAAQAVEINNARWSIHRLQLSAADLDLSWRGVVMTGDQTFRDRFTAVRKDLDKEIDGLNVRYASASPHVRDEFDRMVRAYTTRVDEMERVMKVHDDGEVGRARIELDRETSNRFFADADRAARGLLKLEVGNLRDERDRFFEALTFGRYGVILMTLAALVGVGAFRHASMRLHRQREEQRSALERERERLESAVAQRTHELRALAQHLQTAVENERALLARELHDELGALLTAAKLDVARLKSKLPNDPGRADLDARLAHLDAMLVDGITLKRQIIESLRPSALNNLGLVPALEVLVRESQERLGIDLRADLVPVPVTSETALTVYRFVQEALTNIARHAHARHVRVSLAEREGSIVVAVHDDGVGFDPSQVSGGGHGLSGMRFRVESLEGRLTMRSAPGDTLVTATIPVSAKAASSIPA